jgi:hypothetical protein
MNVRFVFYVGATLAVALNITLPANKNHTVGAGYAPPLPSCKNQFRNGYGQSYI